MAVKRIRGFLILALLGVLLILFPVARRHAQTNQAGALRSAVGLQRATSRAADDGSSGTTPATAGRFVIYRNENGSVCRQMTPGEAAELRLDERSPILNELLPRNLANGQAQTGLKITLRGTAQLQSNAAARDAFLRAAAKWEGLVQNQITIVIDVDFGTTLFGKPYDSPNIIGSSDTQSLLGPAIYSFVRSALNAGATNAQTGILGALPPTSGVVTDSGTTRGIQTPSANFRALGLIDPIANPTGEAASYGSPPSIGFNSAFSFDFDAGDGIDANKIDFEAAALHEIGHVLGFTSSVGQRELDVTFPIFTSVWDLYRVRPGTDLTTFTTAKRFTLSGGDQFFFGGGEEQPLSTGKPDGTGGDEEQASHWKDDGFIGRLIGLMDPTLASGRRERISTNDVEALSLFGYRINQGSTVFDEFSADDGTAEAALSAANTLFVNRVTPNRYPAKVETLRLRFSPVAGAPSPTGSSLRIVVFTDAQRTGRPPANPQFVYDQSIIIPALPSTRFLDIPLVNGPTINAGDLYFGFLTSSADVRYGGDLNGTISHRSFISVNNGASFSPLRIVSGGEIDVNLMARAELSTVLSSIPAPVAEALSPNAASAGEAGVSLFINGRNFQSNSVVRWNGSDRMTTLLSGTQLRATIPASDLVSTGTAQVTVFTPVAPFAVSNSLLPDETAGESSALPFSITSNRPVPTLTRLDPNLGAVAGAAFTLSLTGTNFHASSVVRWNGVERTTTVINSVKLSASIPSTDLNGGNAEVAVATPGPGGGVSNTLTFLVSACSYDLSSTSLTFNAAGGASGVTISTLTPCLWTAQSSVPWLTLATTSGAGKSVITFQIASNSSPNGRSGTVTIGGRQLAVRQLGLLTSVSAASFAAPLAPESIGAAFGAGLANTTQLGTTVPLATNISGTSMTIRDANLVTRSAGLFFVSANQINFLVPAGTATGSATVTAFLDGVSVANGTVTITSVAPGIFTANNSGTGVPAAFVLRVRGAQQISEDVARFDAAQSKFVTVPIDFGPEGDQLFLVLFGSGIRGLSSPSSATARIGDTSVTVAYAGQQGSFVGQDQVNLELQRSLIGKGEVPVNLTVGLGNANVVIVNFK